MFINQTKILIPYLFHRLRISIEQKSKGHLLFSLSSKRHPVLKNIKRMLHPFLLITRLDTIVAILVKIVPMLVKLLQHD